MMFSVVAPASAQSVEDMSLEELIALVTQLQSSLGDAGGDDMSGGSTASVCPYTWTRDLSMGSTGADVMALQQFLNSMPETQVAPAGSAGSPGMETSYYGPATGAAVANFQMMYRAEILTPLGLVNPTQYFGAGSRAQANALCTTPVDMGDDDMGDEDGMDDEDEDEDDTPGSASLGNDEGDIDGASRNSSDDSEIQEGALGAIFEFELDIEGDVEVDRLDLYLEVDDSTIASDDAEDYFTEAQLWVDGEEIASLDVDDWDDDDYTGNVSASTTDDEFRLRFSNLGLVYEDGDEPVFVLGLVGVNNIDSDDLDAQWNVALPVDGIRFIDGVGFTGNAPTPAIDDNFDFEVEDIAELDITKSSDSEDGRTIEVDEDSTSDEFPIMILEIEEEEGVDVVIDEMTMTASTTNSDVTSTIDEVLLVLDSEVIGSDSPNADGDLRFEDLDLEVDGDETVEVAVHVVFNGTEDYAEGDSAFITFNAVTEAEDENGNDEGDIDGASNAADFDSDTFTLRSEGLAISIDTITENKDSASFSGDFDTGTYVFTIDVEAFGEDFYIDEDASVVNYTVLVDGTPVDAASSSASLTVQNADDANTADWKISDTDTNVQFVFTVETADDVSGTTRVRIDSIDYADNDDGTEDQNVTATPASDWRSGSLILN